MRHFSQLSIALATCAVFAQDYTLGPGDVVQVQVINLDEVNGEYQVDGQGNLTMPYLERIKAASLTPQGLQELITQRLARDFLNDPQVIVKVKEQRSRPVSVIGAVNNPGSINDTYNADLLRVLSKAGGLTDNASDKLLVIRKSSSGLVATLEINLQDLLYEGKPHLNIPLFPGDTVNVPVDIPISVYVTGEVVRPGELKFSSKDKVSLLQVISKAGGFTDYAHQKRVVVKRQDDDGRFNEFKVNVKAIKSGKTDHFAIQPNDIVIVP